MTSNPTLPPAHTAGAATRRYDLDWLRVIAFAILIFYHVGMFYVTWGWHVKSPHASPLLEPAMSLVNPWRLGLLFFISGVAIHFASDKTTQAHFLRSRFARLFVPIVFGMLVVVAPQAYAEMVFKGEAEPGFVSFYLDYVTFSQDFSIVTPTWNHLWYVVYIFIYTVLLVPFLPLLKRLTDGPLSALFNWFARRPAMRLLILPALPFLLYGFLLDPSFPTTHALFDDWANHAHCLTFLLLGFAAAKSTAFWNAVRAALPAAIATVLVLGVALFAARMNWNLVQQQDELMTLVRGGRIFYAWAVIVALLGLAQAYLARPGRLLTYLTGAIFPYYILHQTLIVVTGFVLIPLALPVGAEVAIIVASTLLGCIAGYEIIRRVPPLRPLFGLPAKVRPRSAARVYPAVA